MVDLLEVAVRGVHDDAGAVLAEALAVVVGLRRRFEEGLAAVVVSDAHDELEERSRVARVDLPLARQLVAHGLDDDGPRLVAEFGERRGG